MACLGEMGCLEFIPYGCSRHRVLSLLIPGLGTVLRILNIADWVW